MLVLPVAAFAFNANPFSAAAPSPVSLAPCAVALSALSNGGPRAVRCAGAVCCDQPDDDPLDKQFADEWTAVRAGADQRFSDGSLPVIFSRPSPVSDADVVVHEHDKGWRTLSFVGEYVGVQSVSKVGADGRAEARAIASDYLKTMCAVSLSAVAVSERFMGRGDEAAGANEATPATPPSAPLRMCFLGMGAGTLPTLLCHHLPSTEVSTLHAVEFDGAVTDAARECLGLDPRVHVDVGDALCWIEEHAGRLVAGFGADADAVAVADADDATDDGKFDVIFVDIFDGENLTPPAFYSSGFLRDVRACLSSRGVVIHNLHSGSATLDRCVNAATEAYAREFPRGACAQIPALRRGNTILAAAATPDALSRDDALQDAAIGLRAKHGFLFDVAARCRLQPILL